jgi:anti-sigma factor RsiW
MTGRDGHLGDLAAALVDGALDSDTRDRALAHVAGCTACRGEVDEQRRLKDRLRRLAEPDLSAGLSQRLCGIGGPTGPTGPPSGRLVVPSGTTVTPRARMAGGSRGDGAPRRPSRPGRSTTGTGPGGPPVRSRRRQARRFTGGVTVLAMGVAVVVVALGPSRDQGPAVTPAVVRYTVEHAQTTGGFPGADPAAGAVMTASADR